MADVTKLWIASKMKKLMERKPISKIRVSEICRLAEIERSTFYYHFKDKYDLVAWIFYYSAEDMDVIDPAAAAAHRQLHGENGHAHDQQKQQVKQHEHTAAVGAGNIRELPHIADTDGTAGTDQQEAQSGFKAFSFHKKPSSFQESLSL